jgi:hypothetical protein
VKNNDKSNSTIQQTVASLTLAANFPPVSLTLVANLPPVSTTPAVPVPKYTAAGVVDTSAKFATGVVDSGVAPSLTCEYLREFSKKF